MSYLRTGGKELGTNKQPPPRIIWEKSKGEWRCQSIYPVSKNPSRWGPSCWAMPGPPGRTLSQSEWPEKAWKLTPSPYNPRPWATGWSSPPGFLTLLLSAWVPLSNKVFFFFFSWKFYSQDPWKLILFSMFSNFSLFRQCSIYKRLNIDINGIKYYSELGTHIYDQLGFNKGSRQFNG